MARPESEPKTPLAQRIREVRRLLGDPERGEVATRLGVGRSTLAYYERGDAEPTASVLTSYRTVYSVNVDWLLTGIGKPFIGEGVVVDGVDLAVIRKFVWNIAATFWRDMPRRTTPEAFADQTLDTLDYLIAEDDEENGIVTDIDVARRLRTSGQDG